MTRSRPGGRWSADRLPVGSVLLAGCITGPAGINLISPGVLTVLDAIGPAALAAIGVRVGLMLPVSRIRTHSWSAGLLDALLCVVIVSGGIWLLAPVVSPGPSSTPVALFAVLAAICAGTSSVVTGPTDSTRTGRLVAETGSVPLLVLGALALAWARHGSPGSALSFVIQSNGIALVFAAAGWLALRYAASANEQQVFAVATLALVGGAADYLAASSLLAGVLAGLLWRAASGPAFELISRNTNLVLYPSLGLVLLMAGAHAELTHPDLPLLAIAYVALRTAAKRLSGLLLHRLLSGSTQLLAPGVLGVALALNLLRAAGPDASLLLSVVVVGTIGADWLAAFSRSTERRA
ncbi:MAG: hypothetical protein AB7I50_05870 [Vicinamibacterales bacterium]